MSGRKGNLVAVNLSSIPEELFESEMQGYERGAFTGASGRKIGLLELADEGTLFIDELPDIGPTHSGKAAPPPAGTLLHPSRRNGSYTFQLPHRRRNKQKSPSTCSGRSVQRRPLLQALRRGNANSSHCGNAVRISLYSFSTIWTSFPESTGSACKPLLRRKWLNCPIMDGPRKCPGTEKPDGKSRHSCNGKRSSRLSSSHTGNSCAKVR